MGDGVDMGADALWPIIDDYLERGKALPEPTFELLDEGTMVAISVEVDSRDPLVSTKEAAKLLGVSGARVRQMIRNGQLDWRKRGRDNFVHLRSVEERLVASPKAGRPKKEASGSLPTKNADAKV